MICFFEECGGEIDSEKTFLISRNKKEKPLVGVSCKACGVLHQKENPSCIIVLNNIYPVFFKKDLTLCIKQGDDFVKLNPKWTGVPA